MLQSYASGDGAIHFTHLDYATPGEKFDASRHFQSRGDLIANGQPVTKEQVEAYVNLPQNERFKDWWILQVNGSHWVLVHPVVRVDANQLYMDGKTFQYMLDPAITVEKRFLTVMTNDDEGPYEVRNISTLMALIYFVRNENQIVKLVEEAGLPVPQLPPTPVPTSAYTD